MARWLRTGSAVDQGWDPDGCGIVSTLGRLGRRPNGTEILVAADGGSVLRLLHPALAPWLGGRRGRVCRPAWFSLQTVEHGFPHQPSALGYSPCLRILAIGTRSGAVKLYPSRSRSSHPVKPWKGWGHGISEVREGPPPSRGKKKLQVTLLVPGMSQIASQESGLNAVSRGRWWVKKVF